MKEQNLTIRFLRLFPAYRELEFTIRKQHEAQELSAAVIRSYRADEGKLQKKIDSDTNLIESLNRHIATLEAKAAYQADLLKDLKRRLKGIITKPKKWPRKKT